MCMKNWEFLTYLVHFKYLISWLLVVLSVANTEVVVVVVLAVVMLVVIVIVVVVVVVV